MMTAARLALTIDDVPLCDPISFTLSAGDAVVVYGDNGAGKSTLLRAAAGWHREWSGTLDLQADLTLAYLGHANGISGLLTAREHLRYTTPASRAVAEDTLTRFGLSQDATSMSRELSAGQQRRLALAGISLKQSSCWVLDEPYAGLDDRSCVIVDEMIEDHRSRGGAVLMAVHSPPKLQNTTDVRLHANDQARRIPALL